MMENGEILEGRGSFVCGAQLERCGEVELFQVGNIIDGLDLWMGRRLLYSLFESFSNLSSSEIV